MHHLILLWLTSQNRALRCSVQGYDVYHLQAQPISHPWRLILKSIIYLVHTLYMTQFSKGSLSCKYFNGYIQLLSIFCMKPMKFSICVGGLIIAFPGKPKFIDFLYKMVEWRAIECNHFMKDILLESVLFENTYVHVHVGHTGVYMCIIIG